jgi:small subunit ribosomal protein S10
MKGQRIRIKLQGFDYRVIDQSAQDIVETAKRSGARVSGPIPLPTRIEKLSVNRSPHVDKKSMEQFGPGRTRGSSIFIEPTAQTVDELKKLNLPSASISRSTSKTLTPNPTLFSPHPDFSLYS